MYHKMYHFIYNHIIIKYSHQIFYFAWLLNLDIIPPCLLPVSVYLCIDTCFSVTLWQVFG